MNEVIRQARMFPSAVALILAALYTLALTVRRGRKGGVTNWCVGWFFVFVTYAITAPLMLSARSVAKGSAVLSMLKTDATSLLLYAADREERLPPARTWTVAIVPYRSSEERPPAYRSLFSQSLSARKLDSIDPQECLLVADFADPEDRVTPPGTFLPTYMARADGTAKRIPESQWMELIRKNRLGP